MKNPAENSPSPAVLLVDDDEPASRALKAALLRRAPELSISTAATAEQALELIRRDRPEAVVLDLTIEHERGPESGLGLMRSILETDPTVRALVLTGHNDDELGIRSLQEGAASFLRKPADADHLTALVRDAVSYARLKRRVFRMTPVSERLTALTGLSTKSRAMEPVIESIAYAASNRQPVLLVGETGVGKGLVAQTIHRAGSPADAPFIRFQPRFGTPDLVSSELFGHQKGAFTGAHEQRKGLLEEANKGTLFIDEVDELPLDTQVSLLHALQERTFRRLGSNKEQRSEFRLIAATNQPVEKSLKKGKLREDFYHRIAHLVIELPPLRERVEDIPDLAGLFLAQLVHRERIAVQGFSPDALTRLCAHSWPGNVRELQAAVEGGVYRARFNERRYVEASDIKVSKKTQSAAPASFRASVERYERQLIEDALSRTGNNQTQAAELLQLDRSTLRRILARKG